MRNSNVSTFASLFVFLVVGHGAADVAGESILDLETFPPTDTSLLMGSPDSELPPLEIEPAFPNVTFDRPVVFTHAGDGSGRVFVCEQVGRALVFPNRPDVRDPELFLDIRDKTTSKAGNEMGLLGLAFHPSYRENGEFFVYYSIAAPLASVISRFRVSRDNPNVADKSSEEELLRIPQPFGNHNGGSIEFGPDGMLYVGLGDGGDANDPHGNGQNLETLLGSILRIDVDHKDPGRNYAIPQDNPFAGRGGNVRGEIWAFGFRNIWRMTFDRATGELWVGDVGQDYWEEIDIVVKGGNYGWKVREGNHWFRRNAARENDDFVAPIWEYRHTEGESITGGFVYRGKQLPELAGTYVYGDWRNGNVWGLRRRGDDISNSLIARTRLPITTFGEDEEGELAIGTFGTKARGLYRFRRVDAKKAEAQKRLPPFPRKLSETGLFVQAGRNLVPSPTLIPYSVNVPLWSDGAGKDRYIALPEGGKIEFRRTGPWKFPVGTVTVKTFAREKKRKLETRLFVHSERGWDGYTYKWNEAQTDAELLDTAVLESNAHGEEWYYPSRSDCLACHSVAAGFVLGLHTRQLNGVHAYAGGRENQLRLLRRLGVFKENPPTAPADLAAFPSWAGDAGDIHGGNDDGEDETSAARVRAYLDVNCAICHAPGGRGNAKLDLRYDTRLADTFLVGHEPTQKRLGGDESKIVLPGRPGNSELLLRMLSTGPRRMPAVASSVIDWTAVRRVGKWIETLPVDAGTPSTTLEWEPLVNGKDLSGWRRIGGFAEFKVEGDEIVGKSLDDCPMTYLSTDRIFGDFEFEFEVKLDPKVNSGVQVRSQSLDSYRNGKVFGYQVEIAANGNAGFIYDEERRGWISLDRSDPKARAAYKAGAWNAYRIVCKGDRIQTWVNGVPVVDLRDRLDLTGFIGLQVHSFGMPKGIPGRAPLSGAKNPSYVRWRNLRIRSLDD